MGSEKARGTVPSRRTPSPALEPGAGTPGEVIFAGFVFGVQAREDRLCAPTVAVSSAMAATVRPTSAPGAIGGSAIAPERAASGRGGEAAARRASAISAAVVDGGCTPGGRPRIGLGRWASWKK